MLHLLLTIAWIFQGAQQPAAAKPLPPVEVNSWEADEHRIGDDWLFLRVNTMRAQRAYVGSIVFDVIVDPTGAVVSATARPPDRDVKFLAETFAQAESLVRALHYKPFDRDGHPVSAKLTEYVHLLPPELRPVKHVPFPRVKDWKTLKIAISRKGCFGTCPQYSVEVHGDGTVLYDGEYYVAFQGRHRGLVPRENVIELVELFQQADYYSLRDEYSATVTDNPTKITSIEIDGRQKQVIDYVGLEVGMPIAVTELEDAIDRLSGSLRWTRGNGDTLAALESEHWDFKSAKAAATLARVAHFGNAQAVADLVAAGVPISARSEYGYTPLVQAAQHGDVTMLRALLGAGAAANAQDLANALVAAANSGKVEAFRLLLGGGGFFNSRDEDGRTVLIAAATSGSPAMVREVLKFHPDLNARFSCADCSQDSLTPLMEVARFNSIRFSREDVLETAQLLIQAGADVNARDKQGNTALILCVNHNDEIALPLIQAGADVNARNNEGDTALSKADHENTKRLLIEHGAAPSGKEEGEERKKR